MNTTLDASAAPLPLHSIRKLGDILSYSPEQLRDAATHATQSYHPFTKPKKNGGRRTIHNPAEHLKHIQHRIYTRLLKPLHLSDHLHGGITGRSTHTNALPHVSNPLVITIDMRHFFPSISERIIYNIWRYRLACGHDTAELLTTLTSYKNQLPQGAPTSTALANLALFNTERDLQQELTRKGLALLTHFTRFVDDITISGNGDPPAIIATLLGVLRRHGFRCAREKIHVMHAFQPQLVTNLLVNARVAIPKQKRKTIRAAVRSLEKESAHEQQQRLPSIEGQVLFLCRFHHHEGTLLAARIKTVKERLKKQQN